MISRLGIFGGMFDPVHKGHIEVARYARDKFSLDLVKLVPCASPNHREPASATGEQRLCMLELAVSGHTALAADAAEINRPGVSYSVDTVAEIRQSIPDSRAAFIMGLDSFNTLPDWHDSERLLQLCHLIVLSRPGAVPGERVATAVSLASRRVREAAALFSRDCGNIYIAEDFRCPISSTLVRDSLRAGGKVEELLDEKVCHYIEDNGLYLQPR